MRQLAATVVALTVLASACSADAGPERATPTDPPPTTASTTEPADTAREPTTTEAAPPRRAFPPAPEAPSGPLSDDVIADLDTFFASLTTTPDIDALIRLDASGDPRLAWLITDVMRFTSPNGSLFAHLTVAWMELTGVTIATDRSVWGNATDHLIAWDTPAPPDYVRWKRIIFELIESGWAPFFADDDADIDWRHLSWGGVRIDDRELDQTDQFCIDGCIPALDDPALVRAGTDEDWLGDERPVFGVVVGDEAIALPKNIMEIHEMINMTLGNRRLGIPYCTLCGSAQAYFTDVIDDLPQSDQLASLDGQQSLELRTTGLLIRSNKVMYDFHTKSVFDTFTGEAVSGPLQDTGLQLEQTSVLATTWGQWKDAHPDSWLIAEDGGIGRSYPDDPLRGRDDNGPIFPIGDADPRLPVQEPVVGIITSDGQPVAFPRAALDAAGGTVTFEGISVESSGGGYLATDAAGKPVPAHEAFWFAWSQFHPTTELWLG